jgi:hypothetical protein
MTLLWRKKEIAPAALERDRIVEAVSFVTTDPAFLGELTLIATFEEVSGGTEVTLVCKNLPPGLRAEDNEAGSRLSLKQLARRFEWQMESPGGRAVEGSNPPNPPATRELRHDPHGFRSNTIRPPRARYSSSGSGYWAGAFPAEISNLGSLTCGSFGRCFTSSARNSHSSP